MGVTCASPSSPALAFCAPGRIAAIACCRVSQERRWFERTANDIAHQGLLEVKGAVETVGFQHVADAAIEPFRHGIGLGRLRRRQAVFDDEPCRAIGPSDNGEWSAQSWSNSCAPGGALARDAKSLSVNSFPPSPLSLGPMAFQWLDRSVSWRSGSGRPGADRAGTGGRWRRSWRAGCARRPTLWRDRSRRTDSAGWSRRPADARHRRGAV